MIYLEEEDPILRNHPRILEALTELKELVLQMDPSLRRYVEDASRNNDGGRCNGGGPEVA